MADLSRLRAAYVEDVNERVEYGVIAQREADKLLDSITDVELTSGPEGMAARLGSGFRQCDQDYMQS